MGDKLSQYTELRDELAEQRRLVRDQEKYQVAHEYFKADLVLDQYQQQIEEMYSRNRAKINKGMLKKPGSKGLTYPTPEVPILFNEGKPVYKFFAFNIQDKSVGKSKLTKTF